MPLQLLFSFISVHNVDVPNKVTLRCQEDVAECWAATDKAKMVFNWTAGVGIEEIVLRSGLAQVYSVFVLFARVI